MNEDAKPAPEAAAWAHIRMRYEQTVENVTLIAKSIGISASTLTRKAKLDGWTLRGAAKPRRHTTPRAT
jgi:transcriptional regulator with PAS, ATPase and Fis domain